MSTASGGESSRALHRYATLEYLLLGDLRELLEEPADPENCRWLVVLLDALLDTLPCEFALEEEGGYMNEVLEEYPSWHRQVVGLQSEHEALYSRLQEVRRHVAGQVPLNGIADVVRRDLQDWMNSLIAHNRHETRLIQTAVNLEVGTGD